MLNLTEQDSRLSNNLKEVDKLSKKFHKRRKLKPIIATTISLLGLPSQGVADAPILAHLMRPNEVNLALQGRGGVLVGCEAIRSCLLELGHQLIGVSHEEVDEVLPIDWLKVSPIWEQKETN